MTRRAKTEIIKLIAGHVLHFDVLADRTYDVTIMHDQTNVINVQSFMLQVCLEEKVPHFEIGYIGRYRIPRWEGRRFLRALLQRRSITDKHPNFTKLICT